MRTKFVILIQYSSGPVTTSLINDSDWLARSVGTPEDVIADILRLEPSLATGERYEKNPSTGALSDRGTLKRHQDAEEFYNKLLKTLASISEDSRDVEVEDFEFQADGTWMVAGTYKED